MTSVEIGKMTTLERLQAMEALWDALCHEPEEPESPEWHCTILSERKERIESGQCELFSIQEARKRLLG